MMDKIAEALAFELKSLGVSFEDPELDVEAKLLSHPLLTQLSIDWVGPPKGGDWKLKPLAEGVHREGKKIKMRKLPLPEIDGVITAAETQYAEGVVCRVIHAFVPDEERFRHFGKCGSIVRVDVLFEPMA